MEAPTNTAEQNVVEEPVAPVLDSFTRLHQNAKLINERIQKKREKFDAEFTYKPKITKKAQQQRSGEDRFQKLFEDSQIKTIKINSKKKQLAREEQKKSTFKPAITPLAKKMSSGNKDQRFAQLYENAKDIQQKRESRKQQEMSQLDFTPKITRRGKRAQSPTVRGRETGRLSQKEMFQRQQAVEAKRKERELQGCTFKPRITKRARSQSRGRSSQVHNNLYNKSFDYDEKKKRLRSELEREEKEKLTFKPAINKSSKKMVKEDFETRLKNKEEQKQAKIEDMTRKSRRDETFRPRICRRSRSVGRVRSNAPVHHRLHADNETFNEKMQMAQKIKRDEELKGCTFRPDTRQSKNVSTRMAKRNSDNEKKVWERLHNPDMAKANEIIRERTKEQLEMEGCSFTPKIKRNPRFMKSRGTNASVWEELSNETFDRSIISRVVEQKEMEECTFKPDINKSSARMKRDESIFERLYQPSESRTDKHKRFQELYETTPDAHASPTRKPKTRNFPSTNKASMHTIAPTPIKAQPPRVSTSANKSVRIPKKTTPTDLKSTKLVAKKRTPTKQPIRKKKVKKNLEDELLDAVNDIEKIKNKDKTDSLPPPSPIQLESIQKKKERKISPLAVTPKKTEKSVTEENENENDEITPLKGVEEKLNDLALNITNEDDEEEDMEISLNLDDDEPETPKKLSKGDLLIMSPKAEEESMMESEIVEEEVKEEIKAVETEEEVEEEKKDETEEPNTTIEVEKPTEELEFDDEETIVSPPPLPVFEGSEENDDNEEEDISETIPVIESAETIIAEAMKETEEQQEEQEVVEIETNEPVVEIEAVTEEVVAEKEQEEQINEEEAVVVDEEVKEDVENVNVEVTIEQQQKEEECEDDNGTDETEEVKKEVVAEQDQQEQEQEEHVSEEIIKIKQEEEEEEDTKQQEQQQKEEEVIIKVDDEEDKEEEEDIVVVPPPVSEIVDIDNDLENTNLLEETIVADDEQDDDEEEDENNNNNNNNEDDKTPVKTDKNLPIVIDDDHNALDITHCVDNVGTEEDDEMNQNILPVDIETDESFAIDPEEIGKAPLPPNH